MTSSSTAYALHTILAYTQYSFFEWGLILFDVMFDSAVEQELEAANLEVCFCAVYRVLANAH